MTTAGELIGSQRHQPAWKPGVNIANRLSIALCHPHARFAGFPLWGSAEGFLFTEMTLNEQTPPDGCIIIGIGRDLPQLNNPPLMVWCDIDGTWQVDEDPNPPVHYAIYADWRTSVQELKDSLVEDVAEIIYEQWSGNADFKRWVIRGNSHKQNEARRLALLALGIYKSRKEGEE